jgi:membrane protease YdiL (CAAX protease family)
MLLMRISHWFAGGQAAAPPGGKYLQSRGMQEQPSAVNVSLRTPPWSASEIVLGVFLVWFFWPALTQSTLQAIEFYRWYYGPEFVATAEAEDGDPAVKRQAQQRMSLWPSVLAMPLQALTFPLLFAALSSTQPRQLGLTTRRLGPNVLVGFLGLIVLTPICFGVFWLVRYLYARWGGEGVEKHLLELVAEQRLYAGEWVALFLTAMLAAPVREELTFRGVLQPWLAARRWGGHAAMLGALALTVLYRADRLFAAAPDARALLTTAAPVLFVLGLIPVYLAVWWCSRTPVAPAIFGTSLLFACIHTPVWPSPIPLFVLALGLGFLTQRTGSLVGPIVLHSLFNGISCVQLLLVS